MCMIKSIGLDSLPLSSLKRTPVQMGEPSVRLFMNPSPLSV